MQKYGFIFIHGIGDQITGGYSKSFADTLNKKLPGSLFLEINWQVYAQELEQRIFKICGIATSYKFLRKILAFYGADAVIYHPGTRLYESTHELITKAILAMKEHEVDRIILIGHSLGTVMFNNYLWDLTTSSSLGNLSHQVDAEISEYATNSIFLNISMGSPVTIWSSKYTDGGSCIDLEKMKNFKQYINLYSKYDPIAWPMKCINNTYQNQRKLIDYNFNYGSLLLRYTPVSHGQVWDDKRISRFIFNKIKELS